jgi:hypothetical protein
MAFKPIECSKIVEYLERTQPAIIADAAEQIKKPEAEFNYFYLLLKVLNAFCKRKGFPPERIIGINLGGQATWERTVFIAVCLKLYSPAIFKTDVTYDIRDKLREELAGMLEIPTPNWISQQIGGIIVSMRAYPEFRDQVNEYVEHMKNEVQIKHVVGESQLQLLQ